MDWLKIQADLLRLIAKEPLKLGYQYIDINNRNEFIAITADGYMAYVIPTSQCVFAEHAMVSMDFRLNLKDILELSEPLTQTPKMMQLSNEHRRRGSKRNRIAVVFNTPQEEEVYVDSKFLRNFKNCSFSYYTPVSGNPMVIAKEDDKVVGIILPIHHKQSP